MKSINPIVRLISLLALLAILVIVAMTLSGCGDREAAAKPLYYRNPMDPKITSPVPAKDSMGMDYVPVYAETAAPAAPKAPAPTAGEVPGFAPVKMDDSELRLSGVQTAVAERQVLRRTLRAVGVVAADESRVRHVHTKISGWIEKLSVSSMGQQVRAGEPLLAIYSPQILATEEEYLRARETAGRFAASSIPEVRRGGEDLLTAARRRLELFDVPRSLIARIEKTGKPERTVTLPAPFSGYVTGKEVFEGMEVQPGLDLLIITDLSRVWVEADFYESESRALTVGRTATVTLPNDPGVHLTARIDYVYPTLDPQSRTLKARLELPNPRMILKPGMYVDVMPEIEATEGVVVPGSAVIDSGLRKVVFVDQDGVLAPREVTVGAADDGKVIVLSGLQAGERVAVRANFLLDSESRLRAAVPR
ncbi:MAG TPA: efflux RND transporter periplasmic adaptor subunit [Thermoanaerobaculia bacterium]|jgi:multidrug efflux pump subunit AcrA (membrane-fusion protein)|nr:efflux RND transporter periplasmic adaptor subunit [Thermoanaerobaculia bacterium]